jgi:hypothetical protein
VRRLAAAPGWSAWSEAASARISCSARCGGEARRTEAVLDPPAVGGANEASGQRPGAAARSHAIYPATSVGHPR